MCSLPSRKNINCKSAEIRRNKEDDELQDQEDNRYNCQQQVVSSHLYLKPVHTTGAMDKAVVLRRIRHRKRVNKVKSAVQALLSSPFADDDKSSNSGPQMRWADDAFAAP